MIAVSRSQQQPHHNVPRYPSTCCICFLIPKYPYFNVTKICIKVKQTSLQSRPHSFASAYSSDLFSSSVSVGIMGRTDYLAMKTDRPQHHEVIQSDFQQLKIAARKYANDAVKLGGLGLGTSILQYVAAIAAIYLLIIDRTNWKSNMLTGLLVPYIFLTIPTFLFHLFRGEVGKWIAFVAVVVKLFFPRQVPEWVEMFASIVLLLVVTPSLLAEHVRGNMIGIFVCLIIGCYLLQEHIRASGGFKNAFTKSSGISNTIGIVLLFVYPVWALVLWIL